MAGRSPSTLGILGAHLDHEVELLEDPFGQRRDPGRRSGRPGRGTPPSGRPGRSGRPTPPRPGPAVARRTAAVDRTVAGSPGSTSTTTTRFCSPASPKSSSSSDPAYSAGTFAPGTLWGAWMCPIATYCGPGGMASGVAAYASPMWSSRSPRAAPWPWTLAPPTRKWATRNVTASAPATFEAWVLYASDMTAQPIAVLLVVLVDRLPGVEGAALAQEREAAHHRPAGGGFEVEHGPFVRAMDVPYEVDAGAAARTGPAPRRNRANRGCRR